ncbi:MAG: APC family permease, partial [Candidatus Hydrogenedentota bacterium]
MSETKAVSSHASSRLGWLLVFAVVYADIGTSIFYVPGILYLSIGNLATIAQIITTAVFISIARKYVEICERCPDGGGVVSVCREAFSSWLFLPLLGGSFITVDYFLTSAISGVSGLYYLASFSPEMKQYVLPACFALFVALTALNIFGLKESASLIAWLGAIEIVVVTILIGVSAVYLTSNGMWSRIFDTILHPGHGKVLTTESLMIGYATTWLAYSGLESASQISGAMEPPIRVTSSRAMWLVIGLVAVFSPCITAASISILPEHVKTGDPESLLSSLALTIGGTEFGVILQVITVIAAASLLFMACNTAIVGNYHVNVRLADLGYCPAILRKRHPKFGTPWISIVVSAAIPMVVL